MPLAGPICCQTGQPESFDNCMARNRAGECSHSLPLLSAMRINSERRAGIGISSSVLGQCPRQWVLGERNDYHESPSAYYPRWRGAFGHYAIEMGGPYPGIIQEVRFYRKIVVSGVDFEISGQPDWVDIDSRHIDDSKFVGYRPKQPYPDHERQINVYHWLITGGYIRIQSSGVWNTLGAGERIDYQPGFIANPVPIGWRADSASITYRDTRGESIYPVPLWTDEATERYITDRLVPHAAYTKTGNLALLRIAPGDEWKAQYCPFRDPMNPGQCCMDGPTTQFKPPLSDVPDYEIQVD